MDDCNNRDINSNRVASKSMDACKSRNARKACNRKDAHDIIRNRLQQQACRQQQEYQQNAGTYPCETDGTHCRLKEAEDESSTFYDRNSPAFMAVIVDVMKNLNLTGVFGKPAC
jgi:hypothetical protein